MHIGHGAPHISPELLQSQAEPRREWSGAAARRRHGRVSRRLPIFVPSSRRGRSRAAAMRVKAIRRR